MTQWLSVETYICMQWFHQLNTNMLACVFLFYVQFVLLLFVLSIWPFSARQNTWRDNLRKFSWPNIIILLRIICVFCFVFLHPLNQTWTNQYNSTSDNLTIRSTAGYLSLGYDFPWFAHHNFAVRLRDKVKGLCYCNWILWGPLKCLWADLMEWHSS